MRIRTTIVSAGAAAALVVAGVAAIPAISSPDIRPAALESAEESAAAETMAQAAPAAPDEALDIALNLAAALERDLGISTEEFFAQATTAANLSTLATDWQKQFRDAFGGVWLNDAGQGVVGVAPQDSDEGEQLRAAATDAGFVIQDVALTAGELENRVNQVNALIAGLPEDTRSIVSSVRADTTAGEVVVTTDGGTEAQIGTIVAALDGLARIQTVNAPSPEHDTAPFGSLGPNTNADEPSTNPDGTGNLPGGEATTDGTAPSGTAPSGTEPSTQQAPPAGETPQVPTSPDGAAGSLAAMLNPETFAILMEMLSGTSASLSGLGLPTGSLDALLPTAQSDPEPRQPDAPRAPVIDQPSATDQIVGGTAYDAKQPSGLLECSTGFNGTLNGKPVVITAAHCNAVDGVRAAFADGAEFGTFTNTKAEGIDSALITVDDAYAERFANNLVGTNDGTQAITGTAAPVVGQTVCKMGSRTGFSCGKITETGATIDVAGKRTINNAFLIDVCALPGDSGGVVFSGDKALGISSASNVAGEADCGSATTNATAAGVQPSLSVVPIEDVLAAQPGLELNTA